MNKLIYVFVSVVMSFVIIGCGKSGPVEPSDTYAFIQCQNFVKQRLKSPSTAEFSSWGDSNVSQLKYTRKGGKTEVKYRVSGFVDAQNSFGANIRNYYSCNVTGETGGRWLLDDISIDG